MPATRQPKKRWHIGIPAQGVKGKKKERRMARTGRVAQDDRRPLCPSCGAPTQVVYFSEGKRLKTHFWCAACQEAIPTKKGAKK